MGHGSSQPWIAASSPSCSLGAPPSRGASMASRRLAECSIRILRSLADAPSHATLTKTAPTMESCLRIGQKTLSFKGRFLANAYVYLFCRASHISSNQQSKCGTFHSFRCWNGRIFIVSLPDNWCAFSRRNNPTGRPSTLLELFQNLHRSPPLPTSHRFDSNLIGKFSVLLGQS